MLPKPTRPFATFVIFGLLALLMLLLNFWDRFVPSSRDLPSFVTIRAVEDGYPELFKVAYRSASTGTGPWPDEITRFDTEFPEIMTAQVGRNGGYMGLIRRGVFKDDLTGFFPHWPTVGRPVLNKRWYSANDGRRITVITYEALVPCQRVGSLMEIEIFFEKEGLERRLLGN